MQKKINFKCKIHVFFFFCRTKLTMSQPLAADDNENEETQFSFPSTVT